MTIQEFTKALTGFTDIDSNYLDFASYAIVNIINRMKQKNSIRLKDFSVSVNNINEQDLSSYLFSGAAYVKSLITASKRMALEIPKEDYIEQASNDDSIFSADIYAPKYYLENSKKTVSTTDYYGFIINLYTSGALESSPAYITLLVNKVSSDGDNVTLKGYVVESAVANYSLYLPTEYNQIIAYYVSAMTVIKAAMDELSNFAISTVAVSTPSAESIIRGTSTDVDMTGINFPSYSVGGATQEGSDAVNETGGFSGETLPALLDLDFSEYTTAMSNDDIEKASVILKEKEDKIGIYVNNLKERLNVFNSELEEYKNKVLIAIENAKNKNSLEESNTTSGNRANSENFSSEVNLYQAQVNKEVNSYIAKLQSVDKIVGTATSSFTNFMKMFDKEINELILTSETLR